MIRTPINSPKAEDDRNLLAEQSGNIEFEESQFFEGHSTPSPNPNDSVQAAIEELNEPVSQ